MMTPIPAEKPYYDLGNFHRDITTNSHDCQVWFDRGMVWTYAFHHEEAAKCFEIAAAHDPTCSMAYWGLAYSAGPNYNKPWELFDKADLEMSLKRTYQAAKHAKDNIKNGSVVEQALVEAVQHRYPQDTPSNDYSKWHTEYAGAMRKVYQRFGDDIDVAVLNADAQMNLTPWAMWELKSGKPNPAARTLEAKDILEKAMKLKDAWSHPGLLHSYVHLMEMSPEPELALTAADYLRDLIPDAGHLRHMPSHLDLLVGDYRRAVAANAVAIAADEKYVRNEGSAGFYTMYRLHDYHSLIYAAMFAAQGTIALQTVDKMEASIPESLLRVESPPMADWTEVVLSVRSHVLIRFGRWNEIISLQIPHDQKLYCTTTASIHYAKAIAYAAQNQLEKAEQEQKEFEQAVTRVPSTRMDFPNKVTDTLAIAKVMLSGELEYRRGNIDVAFEYLQKAVDLDDSLIYSEPWAWLLPTRHAFAALLLEQGQLEKAAELYRADLGLDRTLPRARQHPNNVWALHGYHECLTRLSKHTEAGLLELQLKIALAVADVDIKSSCFCRLETQMPAISKGVPQSDGCCDGGS